tara:strand:- start:217 stop:654 length:438 start_codon:yes stop_codon:yes gene_type:complete
MEIVAAFNIFKSNGDVRFCLNFLEFSVHVLQVLEGGTGVESLGASEGAETDLVALSELHVTTKHLKTLISVLITRVDNPSVSLHQYCWSKVVLWVPPVRGACRLAAGAENAFVEAVEEFALFDSLEVLLYLQVSSHLLALQEGFN